MKREKIPGFKDSEIPPRETEMNAELIRSMAESSEELTPEQLRNMILSHKEFLSSGGASGKFERLHVAGLPMTLYLGGGSSGEQFKLAMLRIPRESDLSVSDLTVSDFSGALCEGSNFYGTLFDHSMMTDAFFQGSNFERASLQGVDFTGSDLRNCSFKDADLRNADFEIANCEGADFTGALLDGASFKGANLTEIKY